MGGKGKGKGKKKKSPKAPTIIDGVSVQEMSKEELEDHLRRIREELDREREERNYFQLERDRISTFWEITKRQLEEKKAELRNKDRELEDAEEQHQAEIKVYKQKVKHLLYEQQNNIAELKAETLAELKVAQETHNEAENSTWKEKRELKVQMKDQELAQQEVVRNLKKTNESYISKLREDFLRQAREIEEKYEKKLRDLREDLELRRKTEIHEIEERKNQQINDLLRNHEKAFSDIKNYYNDITLNNLNLINTMKSEIEKKKQEEERLEKRMNEVESENRRMREPLEAAKRETEELRKRSENYEKDKALLASTKNRLKTCEKEQGNLKWEYEVLLQRFEIIQKERDELYNKFIKAINEVQQKSSLKNLLLEKKLSTLADSLEKKEAQLNEVLAASNLDPAGLSVVTRKLEEVLDSKNTAIRDLQYELARAHNDILRTYEAKLRQFGIPVEEIGFKPLESTVAGQQLGKGVAGLVSTAP
ncbi:unnamed protein product [Didymodactylos carnosus]|uniref:Dynein regulatory complex subunit 4 n=2 Tax=Didymodactylos carnosus TaxID=1234261 RepID=A0A814BYX3_9BILA|nr:unnamed protein product [Didymodactylos carnosus]CAF3710888.1 unnamed protein product [Didymodactylos carnosus]